MQKNRAICALLGVGHAIHFIAWLAICFATMPRPGWGMIGLEEGLEGFLGKNKLHLMIRKSR